MPKVQTSLRIDKEIYEESREILGSLGMNFSEAVNIFAAMVVQERGLPFDVAVHRYPEIDTEEARQKVQRAYEGIGEGKGVEADEFFAELYRG